MSTDQQEPYGVGDMVTVTPRMAASKLTCIVSGKGQLDAYYYDGVGRQPKELEGHSDSLASLA